MRGNNKNAECSSQKKVPRFRVHAGQGRQELVNRRLTRAIEQLSRQDELDTEFGRGSDS